MGVQFQNGYSTVDGNYGFGDGCFAPNAFDTTHPAGPAADAEARLDFTALPGASRLPRAGRAVPNDHYGNAALQVHPGRGHQHRQR